MKVSIFFLSILTGVLVAAPGYSQNNQGGFTLEAGYSIAAPQGSFKQNFTGKSSFRGFRGELAYAINQTFAVGLQSGFQNYYERFERQVHRLSNTQSVSAVLTKNIGIMPIMINGTYAPMGEKQRSVQPYVSIGAGIGVVNNEQYLGVFGSSNQSVNFAAKGGLGVKVPIGKGFRRWGVKAGAEYMYCDYNQMEIDNLNSISGHLSLYFQLK